MENQTSEPTTPLNINAGWIVNRVKSVILDPVGTWEIIRDEQDSIKDIYQKYFVPLAVLGAIAGFIGMTVIGVSVPFAGSYRTPFFSTLISTIVMLVVRLVMLYVMALVIQKIATMCEGSATPEQGVKLLAYSSTPSLVAALFLVIPWLGAIIGLFSLYSIYVLWQGIPIVTTVPAARRGKFVGLMFLAGIAVGIVIMIVNGIFMPGVPH